MTQVLAWLYECFFEETPTTWLWKHKGKKIRAKRYWGANYFLVPKALSHSKRMFTADSVAYFPKSGGIHITRDTPYCEPPSSRAWYILDDREIKWYYENRNS